MKKTFRSIASGQKSSWQPEAHPSSLTQWYLSVYDVPIEDFGAEDLCRAVRQELFIADLLPVAVFALEEDLFFGYMDDGELLKALSKLPVCYWEGDIFSAKKLLSILAEGKWRLTAERDVIESANALMGILFGVVGSL
jgi:hypothetical protein